jgi:hypothetical protein
VVGLTGVSVMGRHAVRTAASLWMGFFFYSKTNEIHQISNLIYFVVALYMFRTVFPSIIRSLRLYIHHQVCVIQVLWLLPSGKEMELQFHLVQNKLNLENSK